MAAKTAQLSTIKKVVTGKKNRFTQQSQSNGLKGATDMFVDEGTGYNDNWL